MELSQAINYAKRYFAAWPKINEFFITSDGLAFFNGQDAAAHASITRKDKVVVDVQRSQLTAATAEPAKPAVAGESTPATLASTGSTAAAPGSAPAASSSAPEAPGSAQPPAGSATASNNGPAQK